MNDTAAKADWINVRDPEKLANYKGARNTRILEAAIQVAENQGFDKVSKKTVSDLCGLSSGTISMAFGSMEGLRDEVLRHAIAHGRLHTLAAGLAAGCEVAKAADPDLKARALATLA